MIDEPRAPRAWTSRPSTAPLRGTVTLPGDKSCTHRALILAALAEGESAIRGANDGRDCRATRRAVEHLGAHCTVDASAGGGPATWRMRGAGGALAEPDAPIDCGNSGTALRLLAGAVATSDRFTILDGDRSLRRRPMRRIVEPLARMGARIDGPDQANRAPLSIRGATLRGVEHRTEVASAQVKSCLLLAGLAAGGETWVHEPRESRDHTERMLPLFGVELLRRAGAGADRGGSSVGVKGGQRLSACDIEIPGDFSSAAFWLVAASIVGGSELTLPRVGLNPGRIGLLRVLERMGAHCEVVDPEERCGEPVGGLRVRSAELQATDIGPDEVPFLIDEIPIWAVAAACARGVSRVRGAGELRVKESDRIAGIAGGLRRLGVAVRELPDGLEIEGRGAGAGAPLAGGRLRADGDHRLAMSWMVAGLASSRQVEVTGAGMVDTSYPGFYSTFVTLSSCR